MKIKENILAKGKYRFKFYKAGTKELLRETDWIHNLIVVNENNGLNLIIKRLLGIKDFDLEITKAKMGDNNTAPADADTDLGNVVVDNIQIARRTEVTVAQALIEFFISDVEALNQEYKEFGIFCGSKLFARSLISPTITKSPSEDITCEYTINIANI